jgi:hypothetical protein
MIASAEQRKKCTECPIKTIKAVFYSVLGSIMEALTILKFDLNIYIYRMQSDAMASDLTFTQTNHPLASPIHRKGLASSKVIVR